MSAGTPAVVDSLVPRELTENIESFGSKARKEFVALDLGFTKLSSGGFPRPEWIQAGIAANLNLAELKEHFLRFKALVTSCVPRSSSKFGVLRDVCVLAGSIFVLALEKQLCCFTRQG